MSAHPQADQARPLERLHRIAGVLDAAVCLSAGERADGLMQLQLLAVVKPCPRSARYRTRRQRLQHGATLCSCDLRQRLSVDDAAGVMVRILQSTIAEFRRGKAA